MNDKVEHVRAAKRANVTGGHHCHWPGCDKRVPPAMWGCSRHWFTLPAALRARIWRAYRPGQEDSKTPSTDYVEAAKAVREWIAAHSQKPDPQRKLL